MSVVSRILLIAAAGVASFFIVLLAGNHFAQAVSCDPYGTPQNCRVAFPLIGIVFIVIWVALAILFVRLFKRDV